MPRAEAHKTSTDSTEVVVYTVKFFALCVKFKSLDHNLDGIAWNCTCTCPWRSDAPIAADDAGDAGAEPNRTADNGLDNCLSRHRFVWPADSWPRTLSVSSGVLSVFGRSSSRRWPGIVVACANCRSDHQYRCYPNWQSAVGNRCDHKEIIVKQLKMWILTNIRDTWAGIAESMQDSWTVLQRLLRTFGLKSVFTSSHWSSMYSSSWP